MDVGRTQVVERNRVFWVVWQMDAEHSLGWRFATEGQARYMAAVLALRPRRVPLPDSIRQRRFAHDFGAEGPLLQAAQLP